ncbi:hypothetical protein I7I51_02823 [Histoplasma capsulatum]|uniref:Uncharacterized protein n=1 Tax=Ajellomyces capsulatus TaxID=5037 RepID=A0A8A1MPG9_AJECA|nr:predicted protein [Histoplasma mississippiense (nom. inval.)]EDN05066.1 predicted protein [Histoplasma mississippiense (nom. inval.)]QSS66634.1 hypothetical protein I7I51_02823 [Histoplasma capsulatum]
MAFRPARSLLHPYPEPLPPYTPRQTDPETSSIRSNAPSYVSAAPSYHSGHHPSYNRESDPGTLLVPNTNVAGRNQASPNTPNQSSGLLSSQHHAPGFGGVTASSSVGGLRRQSHLTNSHLHSLYNVSDWVPVAGGLQARHYHNVAKRRASAASQHDNLARCIFPPLCQAISETMNGVSEPDAASSSALSSPPLRADMAGYGHRNSSPSILASLHEESVVNPRSHSPLQTTSGEVAGTVASQADLADQLPISPHEDPDLVGEAAAAMFRSRRLYITRQQIENHNLEAQTVSPFTGRPHQQAPQMGRTHQYSSLIALADATNSPPDGQQQNSRPSTAPSPSEVVAVQPEPDTCSQPQPQPQSQPQPPQQYLESQTTTGSGTQHQQSTSTPSATTTATTRTTMPTRHLLDDDALCALESKTWDFMLAQMADWEERERSWKKFKEDMDKKLNSGKLGLGFGLGFGRGWGSGSGSSSTGGGRGKGKLKKALSSSHYFGHEKKWKRRAGLAL